MKRKTRISSILIVSLSLQLSIAFSQSDDKTKMIEHVQKAEREKSLLSENERKLTGSLFSLLRLAEQAGTSAGKKAELEKIIRTNSHTYQADSMSRIRLCLELRSNADAQNVIAAVKTLGGQIQYVGASAFIYCKIHPSRLRELISVEGIDLIKEIERGRTNVVITEGDVQLKANLARAQYNVSGSGVRVGVISDGVTHIDDVGGEVSPVLLVGEPGVPLKGEGDEGTAMWTAPLVWDSKVS